MAQPDVLDNTVVFLKKREGVDKASGGACAVRRPPPAAGRLCRLALLLQPARFDRPA